MYDSHEDFTNVNEVASISLLWWLLWALSLILVLIATFLNLNSLPEKKERFKTAALNALQGEHGMS